MVIIKNNEEIVLIKKAGNILHNTRMYLKDFIKEGITTEELSLKADSYIRENGAIPSIDGYDGFPKSICTSINEEVAHGIPSHRKLRNGDILSIDIGVNYQGFHADSAWTYQVGEISLAKEKLIKCTKEALFKAISIIKPGIHVGDISNIISLVAEENNLKVIKEVTGHGIGKNLHEEPDIPNYGEKNTGEILKEGMVLAIEPAFSLGRREIETLDDNWTIETIDNSPTAHFEHTIVVTKDGCEILTGGIDG